jgi:hypothetical protein
MRFILSSFSRWSLRCVARPLALGVGSLVTVGSLAACQPDTGPGSVVVEYVLGNSKTCAEVGVADIQASLFKGDYEDPTVRYSEMVSCSEDEVVLEGVPPDRYEVRVIGFDDNGVATFDNLGQTATERVVEVYEAAQSQFDSDLTARPADLLLRWRLGADGFGNCSGVGIARFEVTAYQIGGGTRLLESEIDCDAPGDSEGYHLVPDPDRELNAVLFGEVGVQALAADGSDVGAPAVFEFDPVGAGYAIELAIECTEAGCIPT